MAEPEVDKKYLAGVRRRLDPLIKSAPTEDYDPEHDRVIIFSDHHRGAGDRADDFRQCEHAYTSALGWYHESGYRLFMLGDAEELWEVSRPSRIFDWYEHVMALERRFAGADRLVRFWGNHDDRWARAKTVERELSGLIGGAPMREALKFRVARPHGEPTTIFFVHGHQGTPESDRFSKLARLPVRFIWPLLQRWFGATATTPAKDHALRGKHDRAMFEWARSEPNRILVAGHTHRPVFGSSKPEPPVLRSVPELEAAVKEAKSKNDQGAAALLSAELEYARTLVRRPETTVTVKPPCYFNTGCCSFPDGDVTGIELAEGEIRLVRWPADLREFRSDPSEEIDVGKRVLVSAPMSDVVEAVAAPPTEGAITEQRLAPPR